MSIVSPLRYRKRNKTMAEVLAVDHEELVERCLSWLENRAPRSFDGSFIHSMQEALDSYGQLTDCQHEALANIAYKWGVFEEPPRKKG